MERRNFLKTTGLGLLGLSLLFNPVNNKSNSQTNPIESSTVISPKENLEISIQKYTRDLYESQIHSTKENEKLYLDHPHPKNTPNDSKYWGKELNKSSEELKKYEAGGLYFLCGCNETTYEKMLEKGYLYLRTKFTGKKVDDGEDLTSIVFGEVTKQEKMDDISAIFYRPLVADFEDYTGSTVYGRALKNGKKLILINESAIEEKIKDIMKKIDSINKSKDKTKLGFYQSMLINEFNVSKNEEAIKEKLMGAVIAHEIDHLTRPHITGTEDEAPGYLAQLKAAPYLTLAFIELNRAQIDLKKLNYEDCMKNKKENDTCIKEKIEFQEKAAQMIFKAFRDLGYNKDKLTKMSEDEIRSVAEKIKF